MPKTLGYMLTWTTYGTWLQGDKRRYVKKGQIFPANEKLFQANKELQVGGAVRLSPRQKKLVHEAIMDEAGRIGQKVLALAVCSNHVHLVARYIPKPVADIVAYCKKAGRLALKEIGLKGKIWARGYDKRFCFDQITLDKRIKYVQNHNIKQKPWVKPRAKYLAPGFTGGSGADQ
jgi:REP element-mobilizing transposase RayT